MKYEVGIREVGYGTLIVEAASEYEAYEAALDRIAECSYTIDTYDDVEALSAEEVYDD